ncbi:MAG: hypothetical protein JST86_11145 [Bacteroidetes bacterium]|nr:hypothetical protein [Bacteroidota bacterium]
MRLFILVISFSCAAFAGYAQQVPVKTADPATVKPNVATEAKPPIRTADYSIKTATADTAQKVPVKNLDNATKPSPVADKKPLTENRLANPAAVQESGNAKVAVKAKPSQPIKKAVPVSNPAQPLQPDKQQ